MSTKLKPSDAILDYISLINNKLSMLGFPPNWLIEKSDVRQGQYRHVIENIYEHIEYLSFNKSMSKLFAYKELWESFKEIGILAFISKSYLVDQHYVFKDGILYINNNNVNSYSTLLKALSYNTVSNSSEKKPSNLKNTKKGNRQRNDSQFNRKSMNYSEETSSSDSSFSFDTSSESETEEESDGFNKKGKGKEKHNNHYPKKEEKAKGKEERKSADYAKSSDSDLKKEKSTAKISIENAIHRLSNLNIEDINKLPNCTIRKINDVFILELSITANIS